MTRTILLLGMGAMLGITTRPLPAQMQGAQLGPTPIGIAELRPGIPASDGELTPAVRAHVTRGDLLTGMQRYAAAVREYRRAATIARAEGHLPSLTLWHLASAHFYGGDPRRAAQVLDELRVEAAGFGDLAVEAVSPNESAEAVQEKLRDYFTAGTRLVWVLFPALRSAHAYSSPTEVQILEGEDRPSGGDVVPGFSCRLHELFG